MLIMKNRAILKIIKMLYKSYEVDVRKEKPFEVLVHGILSARTKDETTYPAQKRLLKVASTPQKLMQMSVKQIRDLIYPVGFYRTKSRHLKKTCKILVDKFNSKVPNTREELKTLPGVGGKIADIVLLFGFGKEVIPVDSHVAWVARQLKWTDSKQPDKVRENLHKIIPEKMRPFINQLLVEHGKKVCKTGRPKCQICPIEKYCPSSKLKSSTI